MFHDRIQSRRTVCLLTLIVVGAFLAPPATAAEPLRWKFKVGEKLSNDMTQDMAMTMKFGDAEPMATNVHQRLRLVWNVQSVDEEGTAVIDQTVDHVTLKMNLPGQAVEYDSDSEEAPEGLAAMMAPMYEAMMQGNFELTMTDRGEIKDVKVPEEVLEAIKQMPGAAAAGDMMSSEGFQKMLMQTSLVLPAEPPTVGESWSTTSEMNSGPSGKISIETSYKYEGTKDVDGVTMAVFQPSLKMGFGGNQNATIEVTGEESTGEVLFNQEAGRLDSFHLEQTTKLKTTVGEQTIDQQIDQLVESVVKPLEATEEASTDEASTAVSSGTSSSGTPSASSE